MGAQGFTPIGIHNGNDDVDDVDDVDDYREIILALSRIPPSPEKAFPRYPDVISPYSDDTSSSGYTSDESLSPETLTPEPLKQPEPKPDLAKILRLLDFEQSLLNHNGRDATIRWWKELTAACTMEEVAEWCSKEGLRELYRWYGKEASLLVREIKGGLPMVPPKFTLVPVKPVSVLELVMAAWSLIAVFLLEKVFGISV